MHFFRFLNQVPLNKSNPDLLINVLEYCQIDKDEKITKFSWVTDILITEKNVFKLMQAGRARWKVEYADIQNMQTGDIQHRVKRLPVVVLQGSKTANMSAYSGHGSKGFEKGQEFVAWLEPEVSTTWRL